MPPLPKCNKCDKQKEPEQFYKVHTGYMIKVCKDCYIKIRKKRNDEIKKRKKEFKLW